MVKRIKKRISKQDEIAGNGEGAEATDAEGEGAATGGGFRAELDTLGEDQFTRKVAGGVSWVVDNRGLLIAGGVIAAIAVIAIVIFQNRKQSGSEEAATAFYDAAEAYGATVGTPQPGSEDTALTAEERKGKLEAAQQGFARTRETYNEQRVVTLTLLGEASARLDLGDAEAAAKLYSDAAARNDIDPFARAIALQGKAAALESTGDLAGAIEAWKALEGIDQGAFGLLAGMQTGRLLEAQGKSDEARALYERIKADHSAVLESLPNRGLKADLEKRLGRLGEAS